MRLYPIIYSFFCLAILSCNTETKTVNDEISDAEKASKSISQKDIENLKYDDFGLSNDAKKAINDWRKYQELVTQIEFLKTADFTFFKSEKMTLSTFFNDFTKEMPKGIVTNEISARIKALETKLLKLNSLLTIDNIAKKEKLKAIKEFLITFSNLNLQINKKFEFDANNISKPN